MCFYFHKGGHKNTDRKNYRKDASPFCLLLKVWIWPGQYLDETKLKRKLNKMPPP